MSYSTGSIDLRACLHSYHERCALQPSIVRQTGGGWAATKKRARLF